jgi:hypothetical protein
MRGRHEQLLLLLSDAVRRKLAKISSNLPETAPWPPRRIGDRLMTVTFSLPFGAL